MEENGIINSNYTAAVALNQQIIIENVKNLTSMSGFGDRERQECDIDVSNWIAEMKNVESIQHFSKV